MTSRTSLPSIDGLADGFLVGAEGGEAEGWCRSSSGLSGALRRVERAGAATGVDGDRRKHAVPVLRGREAAAGRHCRRLCPPLRVTYSSMPFMKGASCALPRWMRWS